MSTDPRPRCPWPPEQFAALLDGDLAPPAEAALRRHLDGCAGCRERLDEAASTLAAIRQLPSLSCPEHVLASLRERARSRDEDARTESEAAPSRWPIPALIGGLLAAAAAAWLYLGLRPAPVPPPAGPDLADRPPAAPSAEIERAEREVVVAFKLFHALGRRGVSLASEEVLERGVLDPASRVGLALLGPSPSRGPDSGQAP